MYARADGILDAFYVDVIIVAGQLFISLLMEHFQIMRAQQNPISLGRIAELLLEW